MVEMSRSHWYYTYVLFNTLVLRHTIMGHTPCPIYEMCDGEEVAQNDLRPQQKYLFL